MKRFLDSYTEIEHDISTLRNYVWKLIDELQNAGYLSSPGTTLAFTISGNAVAMHLTDELTRVSTAVGSRGSCSMSSSIGLRAGGVANEPPQESPSF